jgi:tetratricopeptide (TPR) repeat protein
VKLLAALLLGVVLLPEGAALSAEVRAQESDTYASEEYGFRIQRPGTRWSFAPQHKAPGAAQGEDQAKFTLTLSSGASSANLIVYVADWDGKTPAETVRDAAAAKLESLGAREIVRGSETLAGRTAASVGGFVPGADGRDYAVSLRYLAENGFVYAVQTTELAANEIPTAELRGALESFTLSAPRTSAASARDERLRTLAARCGSQLGWAQDWSSASQRAARESKLVLVVVESFPALDLPQTLASGAFSDPDLIALVQERFVPWRMRNDDEAPFRSEEAYGLGPHTWGSACLFVDSDGRVLAETGLGDAAWLDPFARDVLARHPDATGEPRNAASDGLDRAEACMRRGELERANELLTGETSVRARLLQAALLRRTRHGAEAMQVLREARDDASADELLEIEAEQGLLQMRLGQFAEAEACFAGVSERDTLRAPEALFWLGALAWLQRGAPERAQAWDKLIADHPDSPWAWKAAANSLEPGSPGSGSLANGGERLDWAPASAWDIARRPPPGPLRSKEVSRAERDAIDWLIAHQEANGTWTCPEAFSSVSFGYTDATTAICGMSLLPHAQGFGGNAQEVGLAVKRALAHVLAAHRSGQLASGEGLLSVYSIWRQTFALLFLARCTPGGFGNQEDKLQAIQELIAQIQARQQRSGGWPYVFLPGDPQGTSFDPSASFLSAAVLLALLEARDSGAQVEQVALDRAREFLLRARRDDGSFRYMLDVSSAEVDGGFPEAAGRGPVCALAVARAGKEDAEWMSKAFRQFSKHRPALIAVWGKELCHTGPQGQGAHYLFFDYAFAASAIAELPVNERRAARALLLRDVLDHRLEDGSFLDLPALGRAYGTGMALMALRELQDR